MPLWWWWMGRMTSHWNIRRALLEDISLRVLRSLFHQFSLSHVCSQDVNLSMKWLRLLIWVWSKSESGSKSACPAHYVGINIAMLNQHCCKVSSIWVRRWIVKIVTTETMYLQNFSCPFRLNQQEYTVMSGGKNTQPYYHSVGTALIVDQMVGGMWNRVHLT